MPNKDYLADLIGSTMKTNEDFLKENAKEVLDEVIYFISNEIINAIFVANKKENLLNWAMGSYIIYVLQPFGFGIYPDLLIGNLPVCFFELRVLLESLVRHYYADIKYPSHLFFKAKLRLLEIDSKKKSTSEIMREVDELLMGKDKCSLLWHNISREWIHSKGILDKIIGQIIQKGDVPPWGLIIPSPYTKNDISNIKKFKKYLSLFREINNEAIKNWKNFCCPEKK